MKFQYWISLNEVLQNTAFFIRAAYRRKYQKRRINIILAHQVNI